MHFVIEEKGAKQVLDRRIALGESKNFARTQVGVATDQGAVGCVSGKSYELTDSGCTAHEYSNIDDTWSSEKADCKIEGETFVVGDEKLEKVGDIYTTKSDPAYEIGRFDSLEEAKKMLEE